jgi:AraC-like DNA-binding protein
VGFWDATHQQNWGLSWHRNEGIELTWLETGSLCFQIDNVNFILPPGSLTITRPWQPHKLGNPNIAAGKLHWLILDIGVRQPHQTWTWPPWMVFTPSDLAELTEFLRGNEQPVWTANSDIARCFKQMTGCINSNIEGNASKLMIYINELLLNLLEMFRSQKVDLSTSLTTARRSTDLFLIAIKDNLAEPWTLESMAEACGLGVTRFGHYCKEITNLSPMQFLNQIRIAKAAETLIKEPTKSVTDIAFECGFSSSQYFATVFRQYYQCSPTAFKKPL